MKKSVRILFVFSLSILIFSCKSTKKKQIENKLLIIKSSVKLSKLQYNIVKNDIEIYDQIYLSIIDSIDKSKIIRRLDSFILKKYTRKELITSLELDRIFKNQNIEIDRSLNPESIPNFDSIKNIKQFLKGLKNPTIIVKKKDSINQE